MRCAGKTASRTRDERQSDHAHVQTFHGSHLIGEFRAIAGVTPRALLGELRAAQSIG
jgi:hypothetical protein